MVKRCALMLMLFEGDHQKTITKTYLAKGRLRSEIQKFSLKKVNLLY